MYIDVCVCIDVCVFVCVCIDVCVCACIVGAGRVKLLSRAFVDHLHIHLMDDPARKGVCLFFFFTHTHTHTHTADNNGAGGGDVGNTLC